MMTTHADRPRSTRPWNEPTNARPAYMTESDTIAVKRPAAMETNAAKIKESTALLCERLESIYNRMHGAGGTVKNEQPTSGFPMASNLSLANETLERCHQAITEIEKSLFHGLE